jgi:chemotaxis protein CheD
MHTQAATTDVFLLPGEYFVGGAQHRVRTLLGSCVSMTLWDPVRRIGAMSHFLLTGRRGTGRLDARYAEDALALMLAELAALGVAPGELQAKVFGGGNMFPSLVGRDGKLGKDGDVGRRNGAVACALLAAHGIPVLSQSLYGIGHRRIQFDISNGDVWSRQDKPTAIVTGKVIQMPMPRNLADTLAGQGLHACAHA